MENDDTKRFIFDSMNEIKASLSKVDEKVTGVVVDMASVRERQISVSDKIDHMEDRIGVVERLSSTLKERQNLIYGVAGVVSALVTFVIAGLRSIFDFLNSGGGPS